jgi:hypothetical protein
MKKLLSTLLLFVSIFAFGQTVPQGINYQAIAIDESGKPIPGVDIVGSPIDDAEIGIRISILENSPTGAVLYQEEHEVLTDQYGMFNLVIGQGLQVSPDPFSSIDWIGDKYLQVELSVDNNGDFKLSAVQQLMSVPYAFLADRALNVDDADADASNEIQNLSVSGDSLTISAGNTVVLPTSNDLDKDPTNELQQLFVQNDSLFLTADTSGVGYAMNQNGKELIDIEFNKNCFPVPYLDSIPMQTSGGVKTLFVQEYQKTIIVSAYSDVTLVLDSNGNRLAKHNVGFTYGDDWNATPVFNNNVVYRDGSFFAALRINNNGNDTIGSTIITDSAYVIVLNSNGNYQTHFSLDTMYSNGSTDCRISAISGAKIYLQCNNNNEVKSFTLNINTGSFTYSAVHNNQIPLYTASNEYWVGTSPGSDSCLEYSTITNGIKTLHHYSDSSYYIGILFKDYFLTNNFAGIYGGLKVSVPTRLLSAFFSVPGEQYYARNSNFRGRSYIDTNFHFIELPHLAGSSGASSYDLDGVINYYKGTRIFYIRDMSTNANQLYYKPLIWYEDYFLNLSNAWDSRIQFSYEISSKKFSKLLKEPIYGNGLIEGLNLGYSSGITPFFQQFGNFIVTPYGARGYCADNFYGGQYLIMHKDDFEAVVLH